jgi:hypothetical protein
MERQPSYLEEDSPAVQGAQFVLTPDAQMFTIPAAQLTEKTMKACPRSPRSKRLHGMLRKRQMKKELEEAAAKREQVEIKTRTKRIEEARHTFAESLRHPKPTADTRIVYEQPRMAESVTASAKQYLIRINGTRRHVDNATSRSLDGKLQYLRESVELGTVRLEDVVHHAPGSPMPSKRRPTPTAHTVGWRVPHTHDVDHEVGEEDGEPSLNKVYIVLAGAVANEYMFRLHQRFLSKRITLPYETPATTALIVKLQRWVRHKRLQATFWKLLRHRRIVVKALTRYTLRFQARYRHRSAEVVLKFFQTCFEEAGFRMAMKIFLFRVVRTQRVMRTFLHCNRARRDVLQLKLAVLVQGGAWAEEPIRERTATYVSMHDPDLLYDLVRLYRTPYTNVRVVYRRSLRAGDLTPAFQKLDVSSIQSFLSNATPSQPPQYAGGQLVQPTFCMLTHSQLMNDMNVLLDRHEKKALRHARKLAAEAEERRLHAEYEDAVRRGEGHIYQLAQLRKRQEKEALEATPTDRITEAIGALNGYDARKRTLARERVEFDAEQERLQRNDQKALADLYALRDQKRA